jgi:hypothetical protein
LNSILTTNNNIIIIANYQDRSIKLDLA